MILLRLHSLGDERVQSVGADHDPGPLGDGLTALGVSANPDDPVVVEQHLLDGEPFADLGAGRGGGVDEQLVQDDASWGVGHRCVVRPGGAADHERAEVEHERVDGRASGRRQLVQQPPPPQCGDPQRLHTVRGEGVAGKRRPVQHQHPVAVAGQQHRGRGAGG